jgi:hypothetical protein
LVCFFSENRSLGLIEILVVIELIDEIDEFLLYHGWLVYFWRLIVKWLVNEEIRGYLTTIWIEGTASAGSSIGS